MVEIDTITRTINVDGAKLPYELDRERKWNVGLRRHTMALTGRIVVFAPDRGAWRKADNWDQAKAYAQELARQYR